MRARGAGVDHRADRRGAARGGRDPAEGGQQHVGALDLGGLERLRPVARRAHNRAARRCAGRDRRGHRKRRARRCGTARAAPAQPSRGRYERLANAFREATDDEEREKIAGELAATLQSGDALERFYAVNAMSRVDAAYFRDALRTAARDSDRHVADLARRALEKLSRTS